MSRRSYVLFAAISFSLAALVLFAQRNTTGQYPVSLLAGLKWRDVGPMRGGRTFGVSGHAVLKTLCGYDPNRLVAFAGRFSAPVFPGETIRTEMWRDGPVVSFRARVLERDVIAINHGRAEIRP